MRQIKDGEWVVLKGYCFLLINEMIHDMQWRYVGSKHGGAQGNIMSI